MESNSEQNCILNLTKLTLDQIKHFNMVAVKIQSDFNSLSNNIFHTTNKALCWLFSSLLSRNPYQSDLYLFCTQIVFIKEYIDINPHISTIVVSNRTIKKVLKDYFLYKNKKVSIYHDRNYNHKVVWGTSIRSTYYMLYNLIWAINLIISSDSKRKKGLTSKKSIILIDTVILQNSLDAGKYIDRNYTNILSYVPKQIQDQIYFTPTILGKFNKKNLSLIFENSTENMLFRHDFLEINDYLWAFKQLFTQKFIKQKTLMFYDFDITPIVKYCHNKYKFSSTTFRALMDYQFVKRFIKSGINVRLLIDWNENQPIDKSLIRGFRDFSPKTYIKGYQGYICSPVFHFYNFPTAYEVEKGLIPDEINVVGVGLKENITKFCHIRVEVAPAFRFTAVFKHLKRIKSDKNILLLTLPVSINESIDIISLLSKSLKIHSNNYIVKIKPHPALEIERVKIALQEDWLDEFELVNGEIFDFLGDAAVLIGNSSSVLMESLVKGIPVIVIGSQSGITLNPIPENIPGSIWKLVYNAEELIEALIEYCGIYKDSPNSFYDLAEFLKPLYFESITEESVCKFLNIHLNEQ